MGEGDEGEASGASSVVFAPSKTHKRGKGVFSESATSASATGDEESVAASEEKPKRKRKPGRPRTTNVIDQIMARREEREREQTQEREEWERRRMEDPNLVIPPAASLPPIEDVLEEMEHQPTPDLTAEMMQVVRSIEKVATTSRNLKGSYQNMLRLAALKVHAGTNLLARKLHEQKGENQEEAAAELRRKNRILQLDKERLEHEVQQARETRRELEGLRGEMERLRRKNKDLEREVGEIKSRLSEEILNPCPLSPPPLRLSISPPGVGGRRGTLPLSAGAVPPPPLPSGEAGRAFDPSYFLLQQMEGTVARIVKEVMGTMGLQGSMGSLVPPQTPAIEQPRGLEEVPARAQEIPPGNPHCREPQRRRASKEEKEEEEEEKEPRGGKCRLTFPLPAYPTGGSGRGERRHHLGHDGAERTEDPRRKEESAPPPLQPPPGPANPALGPPPQKGGERGPITAAVTITAKEGTYAEVMRRVRTEIGPEKLRRVRLGLGLG